MHVAKVSPTLQVSTFIGPAVLATAVLSIKHVTYLDAATGLFGYFLSENLETITGVSLLPGPSHHRRNNPKEHACLDTRNLVYCTTSPSRQVSVC